MSDVVYNRPVNFTCDFTFVFSLIIFFEIKFTGVVSVPFSFICFLSFLAALAASNGLVKNLVVMNIHSLVFTQPT